MRLRRDCRTYSSSVVTKLLRMYGGSDGIFLSSFFATFFLLSFCGNVCKCGKVSHAAQPVDCFLLLAVELFTRDNPSQWPRYELFAALSPDDLPGPSNGGAAFSQNTFFMSVARYLNLMEHATPRHESLPAVSLDDLPGLSNGALPLTKNAYSDDVF